MDGGGRWWWSLLLPMDGMKWHWLRRTSRQLQGLMSLKGVQRRMGLIDCRGWMEKRVEWRWVGVDGGGVLLFSTRPSRLHSTRRRKKACRQSCHRRNANNSQRRTCTTGSRAERGKSGMAAVCSWSGGMMMDWLVVEDGGWRMEMKMKMKTKRWPWGCSSVEDDDGKKNTGHRRVQEPTHACTHWIIVVYTGLYLMDA